MGIIGGVEGARVRRGLAAWTLGACCFDAWGLAVLVLAATGAIGLTLGDAAAGLATGALDERVGAARLNVGLMSATGALAGTVTGFSTAGSAATLGVETTVLALVSLARGAVFKGFFV
ncbi:MAG: hypothetical protein ACRBBQ_16045 [Cognatishimia sp.]